MKNPAAGWPAMDERSALLSKIEALRASILSLSGKTRPGGAGLPTELSVAAPAPPAPLPVAPKAVPVLGEYSSSEPYNSVRKIKKKRRPGVVRNMSLVNSGGGEGYVTTVGKSTMQLVNREVFAQQMKDRKLRELKAKIMGKEAKRKAELAKFERNKYKYGYCDWVNVYSDGSDVGNYAVTSSGTLKPISPDPESASKGEACVVNGKPYVRKANGTLKG